VTRIEKWSFARGVFRSIVVPESVDVIGKWCFAWCRHFEVIAFENERLMLPMSDSMTVRSATEGSQDLKVIMPAGFEGI
jgi:hypothetical protein